MMPLFNAAACPYPNYSPCCQTATTELDLNVYQDSEAYKKRYRLTAGDRCNIDYTRPHYSKQWQMFPIECQNKGIGWAFSMKNE